MINKAILLMCFFGVSVNAQTITETFGSGDNAFTMDFVTIGNPGNAPDTSGNPNPVGSVAYKYNIGKYEVNRGMIDKANLAGSLAITMDDMTNYGGNGFNQPAGALSWFEAAKFVNYLNTSTGGTAAYKFVGGTFQLWSMGEAGYNPNNQFRNNLAKYVLPNIDEWYKAGYGSPTGAWFNYATGSDTKPTSVSGGTSDNTAVFNQTAPAEITNAGGLSAWGTMAQAGNMWEWTETAIDGENNIPGESRDLRGSSWFLDAYDATARNNYDPNNEHGSNGFRVAMVPEPSALSLLAVGLGGWAVIRRRS